MLISPEAEKLTDSGIELFAETLMITTLKEYKSALIYTRKHHDEYIDILIMFEEETKYRKLKKLYKKAKDKKFCNRTDYEQKLVKGFMHKKCIEITKKQRTIYRKYADSLALIKEIEEFYLNGGLEKWSLGKITNPELFIAKVKSLVEKEIQK